MHHNHDLRSYRHIFIVICFIVLLCYGLLWQVIRASAQTLKIDANLKRVTKSRKKKRSSLKQLSLHVKKAQLNGVVVEDIDVEKGGSVIKPITRSLSHLSQNSIDSNCTNLTNYTDSTSRSSINNQDEKVASKSMLEETLLERSNVKMLLGVLVLLLGTSLIDVHETDRVARSGLELVEAYITDVGSNIGNINQTNCRNIEKQEWVTLLSNYKYNIEYNEEKMYTNRNLIFISIKNSMCSNKQQEILMMQETNHNNFNRLMSIRRGTEIE